MNGFAKPETLDAIRKKLIGSHLSYKEIHSIMDDISHDRLGDILTTYFAAAGFSQGFSRDEIFYMTKAMAETGSTLGLKGVVADKHGIGGIPGGRVTMILVPLVLAAGLTIPKTSSRAITTPAGTADTMEVLAPVTFTTSDIREMVKDIGGCIVWGGGLDIAPADDRIIKVERPLAFESFDKVLVSIMAKKIAASVTHLVIDIPYGLTAKVRHPLDARTLGSKFSFLGKRFGVHIAVSINHAFQPVGRGIGAIHEARDVLRVLEQHPNRPIDLEEKSLHTASLLFQLTGKSSSYTEGLRLSQELLSSGKALEAMKLIIKRQGGSSRVTSSTLTLTASKVSIEADKSGKVVSIDNKALSAVARVLGCPADKDAGMFLNKKAGEPVDRGDNLVTLFSSSRQRLADGVEYFRMRPFLKVS